MSIRISHIIFLVAISACHAQTSPTWTTHEAPDGKEFSIISEERSGSLFRHMTRAGGAWSLDMELLIRINPDSVVHDETNFHIGEGRHYITLPGRGDQTDDQLKIFPSDTQAIYYEFSGHLITGVPADTCWLFRMVEGRINVYSPYPTEAREFHVAIQQGGGPIVRLNQENLMPMVSDNLKVMKLVRRGRLHHAIWKYNETHE